MTALVALDQVGKRFGRPPSALAQFGAKLGLGAARPPLVAVSDVTLDIAKGEALGLVGESGCGKSTLGRVIAGIHAPTSGVCTIEGQPVMADGHKATRRVQMVFQDPFASLDPRRRVGDTIAEGPLAHGLVTRREAQAYVARWMDLVGLDPDYAGRFPHQFSGGQRQRIAIARALAMQPDVLVCDEPVASLDVSIQAQIVNLFLKLRRELDLTLLFISHDLSVVRHLCDRVAIMYLGRVVELGPTQQVYAAPTHPYTRGLLDSVPKLVIDAGVDVAFKPISGELPSPLNPPAGCAFHTRCPIAIPRCAEERPLLRSPNDARDVACHLA